MLFLQDLQHQAAVLVFGVSLSLAAATRAAAAGLDSSGYTHLEVYLNSLATPPSVGR